MRSFLVDVMPWVLSCVTIYMMIEAGNKRARGWAIGIGVQCLWPVWTIASESWGFLPLNAAMLIICVRNLVLWTRETEEPDG